MDCDKLRDESSCLVLIIARSMLCLSIPVAMGSSGSCAILRKRDAEGRVRGGEGGIRTPGTFSGTPVFKTGAINHSATSPQVYQLYDGVAASIHVQRC